MHCLNPDKNPHKNERRKSFFSCCTMGYRHYTTIETIADCFNFELNKIRGFVEEIGGCEMR